MVLHWAISIVSCFQANGMQFVDGNANDRGCQLKERDCRTQWGASSHYDPRGILESIHGYRMSKVPQAILDVWSFFHYLACDPKPTSVWSKIVKYCSCLESHKCRVSDKCRVWIDINGLTYLNLNLQYSTVVVQISTAHNQRSMIKWYLFVWFCTVCGVATTWSGTPSSIAT